MSTKEKNLPAIIWTRGDWIAGKNSQNHHVYETSGKAGRKSYRGDWVFKNGTVTILIFNDGDHIATLEAKIME